MPGTPTNPRELALELRALVGRLNAQQTLSAWRIALQEFLPKANAAYFLLFLNSTVRTLHVTPFQQHEFIRAQEAYAEAEKRVELEEEKSQAILVAVEILRQLRRAFPNYFLDTGQFMNEVRTAIAKRRKT